MAAYETQGNEDAFKPYDQFLLFGDSITQMACNQERGFAFHAALQESYSRRLDVINRGLAGYTTAQAVKVFDQFFPSPQTANVRFMTIFFGANDACVPTHNQHVPLDQYKENLKTIIQHPATRAQNPQLILISPPPVNEYQLEEFDAAKDTPFPSRTASFTKLYAEAACEVGASLNIPVVDLWSAFMKPTGWQEGEPLIGARDVPSNDTLASLLTDGLHLTPAGNRIVYDELMKVIQANWPDQTPETLPMCVLYHESLTSPFTFMPHQIIRKISFSMGGSQCLDFSCERIRMSRSNTYLKKPDLQGGFYIYQCTYKDHTACTKILQPIQKKGLQTIGLEFWGEETALLQSHQLVDHDDAKKFDGATSRKVHDDFKED
ncbi:GDSL Lipase/Acylhydrolase family protein [Penicillium digitatum PHI26]|uniref:GDSL Lipase/Acylhydrolase family protein n=2 Tax=Penicillium digitatum TaxID=36651 RepID=K9FYE8_PEND2|nr:GDSL Lipase/Acylhydrolase family protein [Penicillium digitatum Pd1]EKV05256.1 GDSL Lipase/Acylhydrolase family protein [Penicillium digitatum Pd1]EKV13582.1 GDSL Lipase/Acylhydrolase family protein [Penicillium digitatum PHI26]